MGFMCEPITMPVEHLTIQYDDILPKKILNQWAVSVASCVFINEKEAKKALKHNAR